MTNDGFLQALEESFKRFISSGTSRSTAKLIPLHGAIARDMHERFGADYAIHSQGYATGTEGTIMGHYMGKKVDIMISHNGKPVCGIAVKFVMQNYSQNSNNYFENMLGETANIRAAKCPYFQLFAIPKHLPYYDRSGTIMRWETITRHNLEKYFILNADNPEVFYHSPNKTLIYVVQLPDIGEVQTKEEYRAGYERYFSINDTEFMTIANVGEFGNSVIHNNYELFAEKIYHTVHAL